MSIPIKIAPIDPSAKGLRLPTYATPGSSGMDLYAANETAVIIKPGGRALVPCGFTMEIPEGYEAQIRPRSGLAIKHGVTVLNTPGTIDSDYRGEVKVILINLGNEEFTVQHGERIAQMVISQVPRGDLIVVDSLTETERGSGGFGHTGK